MPLRILGTERVEGVEFLQCAWATRRIGRRCPLPQDGSNQILEADMVISAVGELPTLPLAERLEVAKGRKGASPWPRMTMMEGVFVAGDALTGPSKIGWAITGGLEAARSLEQWLDHTQGGR
jgi:glutamate synthase (NADPH/NADH) small chain